MALADGGGQSLGIQLSANPTSPVGAPYGATAGLGPFLRKRDMQTDTSPVLAKSTELMQQRLPEYSFFPLTGASVPLIDYPFSPVLPGYSSCCVALSSDEIFLQKSRRPPSQPDGKEMTLLF